MRPRHVPVVLLAAVLAASVSACAETAAEPARPAPTPSQSIPPDMSVARGELAARAAIAQDFRYAALYTFDRGGGAPPANVVATVATDGTWRVDIPGGALGGYADVAIAQTAQGVFQCGLPSGTCVKVAEINKKVPKEYDPKVQRVFRQWLGVFTDRKAPLSVVPAALLPGSQGKCFSVDSISASLKAAVDVGIYCFADNGLLTAVRTTFGTLTLASAAAAPPTVTLPGPVIGGPPLGLESPPPPPVVETSSSPAG